MRYCNFVFFAAVLLSLAYSALGQVLPDQPEKNWLADYGIYREQFLYHDYNRYSQLDVMRLRNYLDRFGTEATSDDWSGNYAWGAPAETDFSILKINPAVGFAILSVYTCRPELRSINYGSIVEGPESIELVPVIPNGSPRKATKQTFVKVRWGGVRYLVELDSLASFAEKAVGIHVEPDDSNSRNYQKWTNFWVSGDFETPPAGLPIYPPSFKRYERKPIRSEVRWVAPRKLVKEISLGNTFYSAESSVYRISVRAGAREGVKRGMMFYLEPSNEEVFITQVGLNGSIGVLVRAIDENRQDYCLNDSASKFTCPSILKAMRLTTKIGDFMY
jgi:hypothetical protein